MGLSCRTILLRLRNRTNSVMPSLNRKRSLLLGPLVAQVDEDAGVEEGQLTEPVGEDLVFELPGQEKDLRVGLEGDLRPRLLGLPEHRHLLHGLALRKAHVVDAAIAAHLGLEPFGDGIDAFCPDPMQAAGHLVGALAEFPAGMKIGQDQLQRRDLVDRMQIDGDAAPVVLDRAGAVEVNGHRDLRGETGERLVDGVVDDLEDAVVQPPLHRVSDVHVRALPHALETLELLDF